ncbi:hypothetical protein B2K_25520 [Paenibacillus mucilaginosus K02]|uniref:Uncharacterized protein n=2 Tax=Paenibacillus mucilaginosus TaxID=61624 RepID=I0BNQ7_9BACL|nr:hypothetical protein KNP414_05562 [Paenibacillus mucilaginosus KNP414]AFH64004.1 hypothetical protein B2K_25520 [Paenibacillus mucilaginosus K02]
MGLTNAGDKKKQEAADVPALPREPGRTASAHMRKSIV